MTLDFMLLIVDDSPDDVRQALAGLRDHLEARGFSLKRDVQSTDFSDATLSALASAAGRDYDLVMVDYRLGQPDRDGAVVARRLRAKLPYTEMVFYSSDPAAQLLNELAQNEVAGVFVARRQDLNDALTGLADTVIRKTVDLNHMRGIAMAEVAEMDALMEEALGTRSPVGRCSTPRASTEVYRKALRQSATRRWTIAGSPRGPRHPQRRE